MFFLSALTAVITVSVAGGPLFILAAAILGVMYYNGEFTGQPEHSILINYLLFSGEGKDLMNYNQTSLS